MEAGGPYDVPLLEPGEVRLEGTASSGEDTGPALRESRAPPTGQEVALLLLALGLEEAEGCDHAAVVPPCPVRPSRYPARPTPGGPTPT